MKYYQTFLLVVILDEKLKIKKKKKFSNDPYNSILKKLTLISQLINKRQ